MQKMMRKGFFDNRFELLGWEIGGNDGKKNSSAYLPHLPSPLMHRLSIMKIIFVTINIFLINFLVTRIFTFRINFQNQFSC